MNTRITNHILQQTGDQSLVDGLKKHETDLPSFFINGASVKTTDLITTLQARMAAGSNVVSTRASWLTAVQANRDEIAETKTLVFGLKQAIMVAFAAQTDKLADFGLTPRKVRVISPGAQVAAAQKAQATRAARHTMGKKQKLKITGAAPAVPAVERTAARPGPLARVARGGYPHERMIRFSRSERVLAAGGDSRPDMSARPEAPRDSRTRGANTPCTAVHRGRSIIANTHICARFMSCSCRRGIKGCVPSTRIRALPR